MSARRTSWTAADLMAQEFPPPKFAVPDLIVEGLNVIAAPPKAGKSWFALGVSAAIAAGGVALGSIRVEQGEAVYYALEDPARRLKERLGRVLQGGPVPSGLYFETMLPRLDDGGIEAIDRWLSDHPEARLFTVDVFARVRRSVRKSSATLYDEDYAAVQPLKDVADKHGVAGLVVMHTRKQDDDDFLATVSGSYGVTGPADAVLVMKRKRSQQVTELHVTSRDFEERSLALRFDAEFGAYTLLGDADEVKMGDLRKRIVDVLRKHGPTGPTGIATLLGENLNTTKSTCVRMRDADQIVAVGGGKYRALDERPNLHLV